MIFTIKVKILRAEIILDRLYELVLSSVFVCVVDSTTDRAIKTDYKVGIFLKIVLMVIYSINLHLILIKKDRKLYYTNSET